MPCLSTQASSSSQALWFLPDVKMELSVHLSISLSCVQNKNKTKPGSPVCGLSAIEETIAKRNVGTKMPITLHHKSTTGMESS